MSVNNNSPRFSGNDMRTIASLIPRFLDNPDMEIVRATSSLFFEAMDLRKQVMQVLQPEQVDSMLEQIWALDLLVDQIPEILKLLKPMSKEEITGFLYRIRTLNVPKSIRARVIWELAQYPTTDRIAFLVHLHSLEFPIESQARVRDISLAINRLREFYKPYNKDLVEPILALKLKPSQINALVRSLQNFSSEERTQFMQQILSLNLAPALKSASFIKTLMGIPTHEQAAFISQISALNLKPATDELEVFTHFSNTSRVNFIQEAASNDSTESEISEALINFNPKEADPARFSPFCIYLSLVSQDPLKVLLRYVRKVSYQAVIPPIAYQDFPGLDYGGVTRDFMTRLFDGLCGPEGLPMHTETTTGDGPLPRFANTEQLSLHEQIVSYKGVGLLLGAALHGLHDIKIGGHFSPSLYAMLHALSTEEMRQLGLGSMTDITTIAPSIRKKLTKTYLKTNCAAYFEKTDDLDSAIDNLNEGQPNEFLQTTFGIDTMEELLDKENIHSILFATCLIAKGIWKYFQPEDWDTLKGQAPEDLMIKIEGDHSKEKVCAAIQKNEKSLARDYLLRWVDEADKTELEELVFAITASKNLSEKLVINAIEMPTNGAIPYPRYQTCFNTINLHNYPTFELFKKQLEDSLVNVKQTAFTMA